ncbi:hypothetical protein ACA910_017674 [Epithemia clementina (nom. ined.)]
MARNQRVKKAVITTMARTLTRSYHRIAQPHDHGSVKSNAGGSSTEPSKNMDKRGELKHGHSVPLLLLLGGRQLSRKSLTKNDEAGTNTKTNVLGGSIFRGGKRANNSIPCKNVSFQGDQQPQTDSDDDHSQGTKHTVLTHEEDHLHNSDNSDRHDVYFDSSIESSLDWVDHSDQVQHDIDFSDETARKAFYRQQVEEDLRRAMEEKIKMMRPSVVCQQE